MTFRTGTISKKHKKGERDVNLLLQMPLNDFLQIDSFHYGNSFPPEKAEWRHSF